MKRKKLNEAQWKALLLMSDNGDVDFYDLAKVGVKGATTAFLVSRGLAKKTKSVGWCKWTITPEGKEATRTGYYEIQDATNVPSH